MALIENEVGGTIFALIGEYACNHIIDDHARENLDIINGKRCVMAKVDTDVSLFLKCLLDVQARPVGEEGSDVGIGNDPFKQCNRGTQELVLPARTQVFDVQQFALEKRVRNFWQNSSSQR